MSQVAKFDMGHVNALNTFVGGIKDSALLPKDLKGKPGDLLVQMQLGHEIGVSPMTAISGIHVIKGKPTISANLMVTLIMASNKGFVKVLQENEKIVEVKGVRYGVDGREDIEYQTSFTIEEANKAGLTGNDNWRKYTKDMLYSKALGRCARRLFPDVIQGMYAQGELDGPGFNGGPEVVSDMEIKETPKKEAPKKKASKKAPKEEPVIVEAEIVEEKSEKIVEEKSEKERAAENLGVEIEPQELNDDNPIHQFRAHLLRITNMDGMNGAITEWNQHNPELVVIDNPEFQNLARLHAGFLRNPDLDSDLGSDGKMYSRELIAQF